MTAFFNFTFTEDVIKIVSITSDIMDTDSEPLKENNNIKCVSYGDIIRSRVILSICVTISSMIYFGLIFGLHRLYGSVFVNCVFMASMSILFELLLPILLYVLWVDANF